MREMTCKNKFNFITRDAFGFTWFEGDDIHSYDEMEKMNRNEQYYRPLTG